MSQKSGSQIHQPQLQPWEKGGGAQSPLPPKRVGTQVFGLAQGQASALTEFSFPWKKWKEPGKCRKLSLRQKGTKVI